MPMIWIPQREYEALTAVLTTAEQVDWDAYERAKTYLLRPVEAPDRQPTGDRLHLAPEVTGEPV